MEIERRWLVNGWPEGTPAQVWHMAQGYFAVRPAVRIRREAREGGPVQYVLCFKGKGGLAREEVELELCPEVFQQLAQLIGRPLIQKEQRRYALEGILGTVQLFLQSDKHLEGLKDDVCSPAGPAMIGVKTLEDTGFRSSVINAVVDAYQRFAEIGKIK